MKMSWIARVRSGRKAALCLACLALVIGVAGCCTCKVDLESHVVLIVSQPDPIIANQSVPRAALIGFDQALKNGDTIHFENHYGETVTVTFPAGVINGPLQPTIDNCKSYDVTINFTGTPTNFDIDIKSGPDHGGAKIIIDPGG